MQRVRIGLTGLAFVFLAVLLAAVFTSRTQDETLVTPNSIAQAHPGAPAPPPARPTTTEPLAELGIAPGNADSNGTAAPASPPAANGSPR